MKHLTFLLFAFLFFVKLPPTQADSPLTSTTFYEEYIDVEMVAYAMENSFDKKIMNFLVDDTETIDVKAAIINALGFGKPEYATKFKAFLAKKHNTTAADLNIPALSADEIFCFGYLTAMSNFSNPQKALPTLKLAVEKNPESYTVNIIHALVLGQLAMKKNECEVWRVTEKVLQNKNLQMDMRRKANADIIQYMVLYKAKCR